MRATHGNTPTDLVSGSAQRMAIDSPYLHVLQRRHFVLFNVLPLAGTTAAAVLSFASPPSAVDLSLFAAMWLLTGLGISVGFHRLLCHRSFQCTAWVRNVLVVFGSMAAQGAPVSWVAMHRRHHQIADQAGDVHSPNLHGPGFRGKILGFMHAHFTWMLKHEYPNVLYYVPDLLKERVLLRISRLYAWCILLGIAVPTFAGGLITGSWFGALTGFLWGGIVRLFVVGQSIAALNSVLHLAGTQRFQLRSNPKDNSRNSWTLGLLVWGEGWHNNHHAFPYSASFGLEWYRIDLGYALIRLLGLCGLATNIRTPEKIHTNARVVEHAGETN